MNKVKELFSIQNFFQINKKNPKLKKNIEKYCENYYAFKHVFTINQIENRIKRGSQVTIINFLLSVSTPFPDKKNKIKKKVIVRKSKKKKKVFYFFF